MVPSFPAPAVGYSIPNITSGIPTQSATSIYLEASSSGFQTIAMTTLGQSVYLPPVTSLVPNSRSFTIRNAGAYPFGIRDNGGILLGGVPASGSATVGIDNAGNYSVTGTNLEPGLITVDNTFSSTFQLNGLTQFVTLDNNTSIHFLIIASGFAVYVVDNVAKTISTPVTVDAGASMVPRTAFRIDSTRAIVFYTDTTTDKAVIISLSGISPVYTLLVGTAASAPARSWSQENFVGAPTICQLTATLFVSSQVTAPNTFVVAISVSGAAITIGTAANIITSNSVASSTTNYTLTATTALIVYKSGAGAPFNINAVVVSVAGTTCTIGSPVAITSFTSSQSGACSSTLLSPTKCMLASDNNTTQITVSGVTIAGAALTSWTALNIETGLSTNLVEYTSTSATRYNPHLWALSSGTTNNAGIWYFDSTNISRLAVITENAGTVTNGTLFFSSISGANTNVAGFGEMLPQGITEVAAIKEQLSNTAGFSLMFTTSKISGTNFTAGASRPIREVFPTVPSNVPVTKLPSGDYVLHAAGFTTAVPVFRSNGDYINNRGTISMPSISPPTGMQTGAAIAPNRLVLIGTTASGGQAGGSSPLVRLLNIELTP